jgi:hypothetical protein
MNPLYNPFLFARSLALIALNWSTAFSLLSMAMTRDSNNTERPELAGTSDDCE